MHSDSKLKFFFLLLSFAVFFVLPPFLLGGVYSHVGTNLVIISICSAATFIYSVYLMVFRKSFAVSSLVFPLLAIIAFALLQLVPLPLPLLKILSPQGHFFHTLQGTGAHPLTMSATDTLYSVFRVATLLFLSFILSRNIFMGHKRWKQITIDTMIFVSTLVIIVSAALGILQANSWLYGDFTHSGFMFEPILINTNHAACFFGISGLLALTSIYTSEFARKKIFYSALFFLHSIAVAATLSRGGIIAYVLALLLFFISQKKSFRQLKGYRFYFAVGAIVLAFFVIYQTGAALLEKEFDFGKEGYFSKIEHLTTAEDYFSDFFASGSGLGSFSKVFPYYQANPEKRFSELENEPVQFILENGIFFAVFIFGFFVWLVICRRRETKRAAGLLTVLFFVVMHNTLDFNLHNFSTLFPAVAVLVLLVKPIELHGKKRAAALVSIAAVSLFSVVFIMTEGGQKLLGYSPDKSYTYEESLYNWPADYRIPLENAVSVINSGSMEEIAKAGSGISAALSKAPEYYYVHYINGLYLLMLGAEDQAMEAFRRSLSLSDDKYSFLLDKIYQRLLFRGRQERSAEILSLTDDNKTALERFIFRISDSNKSALDFAYKNQEVFFISTIRDLINRKKYDEALVLIEKVSARGDLSIEDKGRLLMYRGRIFEADKLYEDAFKLYLEGAEKTGSFSDYIAAAYCSLNLDQERQRMIEERLKNMTLQASGNLGSYYKWLSEREFRAKNYTDGFKYLERAADVSKNPWWLVEVANRYANRGMHYFAVQTFLKITREYPNFRPEEMKKRHDEEKLKMEAQEEQDMKELMLRGGIGK